MLYKNSKQDESKRLELKFKSQTTNSDPIFTFKDIGEVTQHLIGDLFNHKFCQEPFSAMTPEIIKDFLVSRNVIYLIFHINELLIVKFFKITT